MSEQSLMSRLRPGPLLFLLLVPVLTAGLPDRGLVLELDRETFQLTARDLAQGVKGPTLPVVLGSPAHPTPAGEFPIYSVVRNPGWTPGPYARSLGARPVPPSSNGPLGVGKIPFAPGGIMLHGGADPLLLGKPVSLGCVRARDRDLLILFEWLEERGALGPSSGAEAGHEVHQVLRRPAHILVR
jgi:hypothetical protein